MRAIENMRAEDYIVVLSFSGKIYWDVELRQLGDGIDQRKAQDAVSQIEASGGTFMYQALEEGFLAEGKHYLTGTEIELLPLGGEVITGNIGIRFLTDYLNGDTYFKTEYPEHNLVRSRTQLALIKSMEQQLTLPTL